MLEAEKYLPRKTKGHEGRTKYVLFNLLCVCSCARAYLAEKKKKRGTLEKNLESLRKKNLEIKGKSYKI